MSTPSLPTCRHCSALAASPSSLAIYNDDNQLTGYRRGYCLAHQRSNLWMTQRPYSDDYDTGCPSCGHYQMDIIIHWETPTQSSRNNYYRPYFTDATIEEWSFHHDGSYAISWDTHVECLGDDIFNQMGRLDPPHNNALSSEAGSIPTTMTDFWQNDNFQACRDALYDAVTIHATCENCERDLPCEFD